MRIGLLSFFILCFSITAVAQNTSSIDFKIKNFGINVDGHFNTFSITVEFDEANSELESLSGTIKVSSIKTGIDNRDEHLKEEEYFDVTNHKQITLKSESITKLSDNQYKVKANLTIKGITKEINIKVNVAEVDNSYKITSNFELDRRDFKVGGGSFIMSDTVKISVVHFQDF
ncbi:YceI family protein [Winogradskyella schleiferi]|uniref:YceI family protein n=1 Tax=Winogradskyella schleiferi TaxID=2686078 RepID=UPI0015BF4B80|nr:YceI family protein [Winogradskyella schleiferi]